LFLRGDYRNEGQNPENLSCVRVLVKMVHVARKLNTIEEQGKDQIVHFGKEITGTKVTSPKTVLGSSLGEDVGFRNNNNIIILQLH
jgi:hypothetical protein